MNNSGHIAPNRQSQEKLMWSLVNSFVFPSEKDHNMTKSTIV